MIKFAPNINWLFPELAFEKRPQAVAEAGFNAFEFAFPGRINIEAIQRAQNDLGLQIVLFNMDVPETGPSRLGFLADPGLRDDFQAYLDETLELTQRLRTQKIMILVGLELPDLGREAQHECIVENLRYAAPLAAEANVLLTIETLNSSDAPGYFLTSSQEGFEIIRKVNHPHVRYQLDTFHLQLMEGNPTSILKSNIELIGHIQFGDVPGRCEPGMGELNFLSFTHVAEDAGYEGYIGLEYIPRGKGAETLEWIPPERR